MFFIVGVLVLSYFFVFFYHPLHMIFTFIGMSLFMTVWMFKSMGSLWFACVMVLVFLGGLMVLFVYVCSLAPSEWLLVGFSYLGVLPTLVFSVSFFSSMTKSGEIKILVLYHTSWFMVCALSFLLFFVMSYVVKMVYQPFSLMRSYY